MKMKLRTKLPKLLASFLAATPLHSYSAPSAPVRPVILISSNLNASTAQTNFNQLPQISSAENVDFRKNEELLLDLYQSRFAEIGLQTRKTLIEMANRALAQLEKKRGNEAEKTLQDMEKLVSEQRAKGIPGIRGDVLFYVRGFLHSDNTALSQYVLLQEWGGRSEDLANLTNLSRATRLAKALKQTRKEPFVSVQFKNEGNKKEDCIPEIEGISAARNTVAQAVPAVQLNTAIHCANGSFDTRAITTYATQQRIELEMEPRQQLPLANYPLGKAIQSKAFKLGFFAVAYPAHCTADGEMVFEFFSPRQIELVHSEVAQSATVGSDAHKRFNQSEAGGIAFINRSMGLLQKKGVYNAGLNNGTWAGGGVFFANEIAGAELLFAQTNVASSNSRPSKRDKLNIFKPAFSLHTMILNQNWDGTQAGLFVRAKAGYLFLSKPNFGNDTLTPLQAFTLGAGAGPRIVFSSGLSVAVLAEFDFSPFQPQSASAQIELRLGTEF